MDFERYASVMGDNVKVFPGKVVGALLRHD
jgi:hypothetical protein